MNNDIVKGNWNITKGKLKQKYAQLTDSDLAYVEGKEEELLGRIQKRTGRTRDEIERYLEEECAFVISSDQSEPGPSSANPGDVSQFRHTGSYRNW